MPLQFGWDAARRSEQGQAEYALKSRGMFCSNVGYPFIFESDEYPEECEARCTSMTACMLFTIYLETGWCQLSSRCIEESAAGDGSAITFEKKLTGRRCDEHSPAAECFGGWVAELGKSIR